MKIALAVYPEINLLDLFSFVEALRLMKMPPLKPHGLALDFCAPAALAAGLLDALQSQLVIPVVAPSLQEYDAVVVAGSQPGCEITSNDINRWLGSIRPDAIVLTTGNASTLWPTTYERPTSHYFAAKNHLETLLLGVKLVKIIAGAEASQTLASDLGLPSEFVEKSLTPARHGSVSRKTKETSIDLKLTLDGIGKNEISTGVPFFDHMLTQIAVHGLFDLSIHCQGDLQVDAHHTVEDVALALGKAFDQALGDRKGLVRMASATVPMEESLAQVDVDFSGRAYTVISATWNDVKVGDLPVTLIAHFLESFAAQARCNLSVRLLAGGDDHHRAEAIFKALARALDAATQIDPRRMNTIPSSKGVL